MVNNDGISAQTANGGLRSALISAARKEERRDDMRCFDYINRFLKSMLLSLLDKSRMAVAV